jgi:hypothetical protein
MTSDFLSLDPTASNGKQQPIHLQSLPPVPSDSSLSSDAGFESTDSKDSAFECQKRLEEQREQFEMEMENIGKETPPPRAQFFLGNGTKSNSARQLPIGGANAHFRPVLRERVYSIQERMVDKALAFMRMGGGREDGNDCVLMKNPKSPTGSRLLERRRMNGTKTAKQETEPNTPI